MTWCAAGCATALGLLLWLVHPPIKLLLLASFGGSSVFLFGLTRAPAAQPRALLEGHLIGAATAHLAREVTAVAVLERLGRVIRTDPWIQVPQHPAFAA